MKRRRSTLSYEDRRGLIIFAVSFLILVAMVVVLGIQLSAPERDFDQSTLCNENLPRGSHNLFIIDASDTLSEYQKYFLRTHLTRTLEEAQENDRITLFMLDETFSGLSAPVVDMCKPKAGKEISSLTGNRQFVERIYNERFERPLKKAVRVAVASSEQGTSPIYEAMSDIVSLRRIDPRAEQVNLTIVSDMIQNSRAGSVFDSGSEAIDNLPVIDLRRANTNVLWLEREKYKKYQTSDLVSSWREYLDSVSQFEQIERVRD